MQSDTRQIPPKKPSRYQAPRHPFDRRTSAAKRFNALVQEFSDELGGAKRISEARLAMVRQLAGVILQAESMQAAIVRGEKVDAEQLVRVANLQARLTRTLGIGEQKAAPEAPADLRSYLAGRGGADAGR